MTRHVFNDSTRFTTRSVTVTITNEVLTVDLDARAAINRIARAARDAIATGLLTAAAGMDKRMQHGARWLAGDVTWSQSGDSATISGPSDAGADGLVGFLRTRVEALRAPLDHPAVRVALGAAIDAMFSLKRR
jgi:hypothetical protein